MCRGGGKELPRECKMECSQFMNEVEEAKEEVETVNLELERESVDSWDEIVEVAIKEEEEPTGNIKMEPEDSCDELNSPQVPVPDLAEGHSWNVPTAQDLMDAAWQLHQRQGDRAEVLRRAGAKMAKAAKLMEEALALMAIIM